MSPVFKAPTLQRLIPKYDESFSSFGFNVKLRRYMKAFTRVLHRTSGDELMTEAGREGSVTPPISTGRGCSVTPPMTTRPTKHTCRDYTLELAVEAPREPVYGPGGRCPRRGSRRCSRTATCGASTPWPTAARRCCSGSPRRTRSGSSTSWQSLDSLRSLFSFTGAV